MEERFAILQNSLEIPEVDRLKRAFRVVPGLTELDAHTLGADAFGILVKNFSAERAAALQGALRTEGIETTVVPQSALPSMPESKLLNRADCLPEALTVYDPLGRGFSVPWPHVMMIAAGAVRVTEFQQVRTRRVAGGQVGLPGEGDEILFTGATTDVRFKEERRVQWLLEIILSGAVLRYSATANKFLYFYLGHRRTVDPAENFKLLVQDLARFAPHALINRGAFCLRQNMAENVAYPSKNAFQEEIIWLLWRWQQAEGAKAG